MVVDVKYKTTINFLLLYQNRKISPLFCKKYLEYKYSNEIVKISGYVTNLHDCHVNIVTIATISHFKTFIIYVHYGDNYFVNV